MSRIAFFSMAVIITMTLAFIGACGGGGNNDEADNRLIAGNFIKNDTTYVFDGIEDTLKLTDTIKTDKGWQFTFEFDSRHAGYGDRTGQALAEVITPHTAVITVENGRVTSAIMDDYWDMKNKGPLNDIEIALAPIEEVTVNFMKSNPVQVGVYIRGGLRDGCTKFHDIITSREGDTINIEVTTQRPKDAVCPAVYTTFERYLNLGTDFVIGTTYTLNVNDYQATFTY